MTLPARGCWRRNLVNEVSETRLRLLRKRSGNVWNAVCESEIERNRSTASGELMWFVVYAKTLRGAMLFLDMHCGRVSNNKASQIIALEYVNVDILCSILYMLHRNYIKV
jgi:hypothetical protein